MFLPSFVASLALVGQAHIVDYGRDGWYDYGSDGRYDGRYDGSDGRYDRKIGEGFYQTRGRQLRDGYNNGYNNGYYQDSGYYDSNYDSSYDSSYGSSYDSSYGSSYDRRYNGGYNRNYFRDYNEGSCPYRNEESRRSYRRGKRSAAARKKKISSDKTGVVVRRRLKRHLPGGGQCNNFPECEWEAILNCDNDYLGESGGRAYLFDRNYEDYNREDDIVWKRVVDSVYRIGRYRDLKDYFRNRLVGGRYGSRLWITNVRPEDKGTYRCYLRSGEYREVYFYPTFPLGVNDICPNYNSYNSYN